MRSRKEVQSCEKEEFTSRLTKIWSECCRVLKDDGLLVFTYHHSRATGWRSILRALLDAGFAVVAAHPIKAEMSVATPKHQAKEPIDIDVVLDCRKKIWVREHNSNSHVWDDDRAAATQQICRLRAAGRKLSRNDIQVIIMGQLLRSLSERSTSAAAIDDLDCSKSMIDDFVESLWCAK